jgi:hypothetical protein
MHVLGRMAIIPVALLYGYLAATTSNWGAITVAVILLLGFALTIVRDLTEDMGRVEAAVLASTLPACLLATIPHFATMFSPGLCTDMSLLYESSLVGSIYLGTAAAAHLMSQVIKPLETGYLSPRMEAGLTRVQRFAPLLPFGFLLLASVPAVSLVWEGACAAKMTHVLAVPALTLPPLALLMIFGSSALRRRKTGVRA